MRRLSCQWAEGEVLDTGSGARTLAPDGFVTLPEIAERKTEAATPHQGRVRRPRGAPAACPVGLGTPRPRFGRPKPSGRIARVAGETGHDDARLSPAVPEVLQVLESRTFPFDVVSLYRRDKHMKRPFS